MGDAFKIQVSDNGFYNFDTSFVPKAKKAHSIQFNLSRTDNFIRDSLMNAREIEIARQKAIAEAEKRKQDSIQAATSSKRNTWRWTVAGLSAASLGLGIYEYSEYLTNANNKSTADKDFKNATNTADRNAASIRSKNADKYAKTAFMIAATSLSLGVLGGSGFFVGLATDRAWMVWDF